MDEWWMSDGWVMNEWWMSDEWEVGEWWKSQKRNSSTRGSQVVTYPSTRLAWGGLTSRSGTRSGANRLVWPELLTYPLNTSYTSRPPPPTHTQQTHHSRPILTPQCTKNTKKHTIFKKYHQNLFWPSLVVSIISIISVILMRGYHTLILSHSLILSPCTMDESITVDVSSTVDIILTPRIVHVSWPQERHKVDIGDHSDGHGWVSWWSWVSVLMVIEDTSWS